MTKQVRNRQMGPFGDVEIRAADEGRKERHGAKDGRRKEGEASRVQRKPEMVAERRERERRERYEREAIEAERNEREMEFERWERERKRSRSRCPGGYKPRKPPAGYKDPHEVCRASLPAKAKEKKRQEIKALMNCIAFTPSQTDLPGCGAASGDEAARQGTRGDGNNNNSEDEASDMTDVTPRSSSSGCSSMSKQSVCREKKSGEPVADGGPVGGKSAGRGKGNGRSSDEEGVGKEGRSAQDQEARNLTEVELEEMKYLQDAFEDLDVDEETSDFASSIISGLSEERRAKCSRKNMTFTNEQLREIERVNLILLKKIMGQRKPRAKAQAQPQVGRRTSAAINRSRMEERIERENKILLKKLQSAKGTTGTLSRKNSQSRCY